MDQAFTSHRWKRKHLGIDTIEDMSGPWEETHRRLTTNWLNKMDHWHCLRLPGSCFQQMATLEAWGCLRSQDSKSYQNMSRDLNLIKGCSEMKGNDTIRSSIHPPPKNPSEWASECHPRFGFEAYLTMVKIGVEIVRHGPVNHWCSQIGSWFAWDFFNEGKRLWIWVKSWFVICPRVLNKTCHCMELNAVSRTQPAAVLFEMFEAATPSLQRTPSHAMVSFSLQKSEAQKILVKGS